MVSIVGGPAGTEASLIGKSGSQDKNKQTKLNRHHLKVGAGETREGNSGECTCEKQAQTSASHSGDRKESGHSGTRASPPHTGGKTGSLK